MEISVDSDDRVRLFRATTIMAQHQGYKNVVFHWLVLTRAQPVAPYERLITGYQELDKLEQLRLENFIDEAFTTQEIAALAVYLKKTAWSEPEVEELTLPIDDINLANPNAFLAISSQQLYMLSKDAGYDLPFQVYGRYDLSQHEPSPEDQEGDYRGLGVRYLQASLKALGIATEPEFMSPNGRFSEVRLTALALRLRQELGLQVSSMPPQEQQNHNLRNGVI